MKRLLIIALSGMMLGSCTKSTLTTPVKGEPNDFPVEVSLALRPLSTTMATKSVGDGGEDGMMVTLGGVDSKAATELTTAEDSKINDLWAIQFGSDGNIVGSPVYLTSESIPESSGSDVGYDAIYNMRLEMTESDDPSGKIYFIANTGEEGLFDTSNAATEAKLKAMYMELVGEYKPTSGQGLPMMGIYTGEVTSSALPGNVDMERLVAKVIVKYKVASSFDFTVQEVMMKNVASRIYFNTAASGVFPTSANDSHRDYEIEDLSAATDDGGYKKFVWYMPENLRDTKTGLTEMTERTLAQTDGKASYIQINGVENTELKSVSYNILLGDPNTNMGDFNVRHNHVYTVTVDLVGANTADSRLEVVDAYMDNCAMVVPNSGDAGAAVFNLKKMTAGWVAEVPKSNMRASILWQDAKGMMTNDNVKLDIAKGTLTVKSTNNIVGNAVVAVYNSANDGEGEILWSWHVWVTEYHPDGSQNYGLGENSKAIVPGGQVHTYGPEYMKVNPGKVMMDRNLGATKTYNDGEVPQAGDTEADKAFGLLYQWGRKDAFPGADGSTIIQTTTESNASTIPIYGASGNTLIEGSTGVRLVNITTAGVLSGNTSQIYSIKNPLIYLYNTISPNDWYTDSEIYQNDALWGDKGEKSTYDPCPNNWRVTSNGTWNDFLNENMPSYMQGEQTSTGAYHATNGRLYKNQVWVPMAGRRQSNTTLLSYVGNYGYCWSSLASDISALHLSQSNGSIAPNKISARVQGFSIRCVQE